MARNRDRTRLGSCAITQNGFVRIISQPRYPNPVTPNYAIGMLARAAGTRYHQFWTCTVSVLDADVVDPARVHSSKQVYPNTVCISITS